MRIHQNEEKRTELGTFQRANWKGQKKKLHCTGHGYEGNCALESGVTHCGGFPVSLPEYRPLSTPGQLLPAIEKIWVALSPSLRHPILLYKKCQVLPREFDNNGKETIKLRKHQKSPCSGQWEKGEQFVLRKLH